MLEHFIAANRAEIIVRCRAKVAIRCLPASSEAESLYGVPLFLDQLIEALRPGVRSNPEIGKSAVHHGLEDDRQHERTIGSMNGLSRRS